MCVPTTLFLNVFSPFFPLFFFLQKETNHLLSLSYWTSFRIEISCFISSETNDLTRRVRHLSPDFDTTSSGVNDRELKK